MIKVTVALASGTLKPVVVSWTHKIVEILPVFPGQRQGALSGDTAGHAEETVNHHDKYCH